ncbi:MAG: hypothetical protein ACSHYC_21395, partial [Alphaproteobacteria bacterium]
AQQVASWVPEMNCEFPEPDIGAPAANFRFPPIPLKSSFIEYPQLQFGFKTALIFLSIKPLDWAIYVAISREVSRFFAIITECDRRPGEVLRQIEIVPVF